MAIEKKCDADCGRVLVRTHAHEFPPLCDWCQSGEWIDVGGIQPAPTAKPEPETQPKQRSRPRAKQTPTRKEFSDGLAKIKFITRYNVRSRGPEFRNGTGGWVQNEAILEAHLMTELAEKAKLPLDQASFRRLRDAVGYQNQIDPLIEWFEALPKWDRVERLDHLLTCCFGADPTPLNQWAARFPILGAITRAYKPGAKLDEIPVWVGPQGSGKSTFISELLPEELRHLYGDSLSLADSPQKRIEATLGKAFVEIAELDAKKTSVEHTKQFLSRTFDEERLAYAESPLRLKRRYVMIATTNDESALPNDPTGNRRYVAVTMPTPPPLTVAQIVKFVGDNREQLWAEGLALYKRGVQAWLNPELQDAQAEINEEHRSADETLEAAISDVALPDKWEEGLTIGEVRVALGDDQAGISDHRLGRALKALGWEHRRIKRQGKVRRLWFADELQSNLF